MSKKELLLNELDKAPELLINEVLDFIRFLKSKKRTEHLHMAMMSETSLKKDWLKPEEDKAWQNL